MAKDELPKRLQPYALKFKVMVCDKSDQVDPDAERDWYDLSYGFFMALGLSIRDSQTLAIYVRYNVHYWSLSDAIKPVPARAE